MSSYCSPETDDVVKIVTYIHSILYGLAIAAAIGYVIVPQAGKPLDPQAIVTNEDGVRRILAFGVFLLFIVPFYHGAALFLASDLRITREHRRGEPVIHFAFLFTEAGAFYAMGVSVSSLKVFSSWIFFLLAIDFVWVFVALILRSQTPSLRRSKGEPPFAW